MYFFCFLTEVSNQSLNNMYDSEVEIMWWILRDQWDQGLKLGYWNKDWDFSIRRVIDENWASLNIGCLALWPEFTVPLAWYFDPWHIRDQHFGSCLLNFHAAFWLLEPYFSLQPSCCKICVFFIYISCCLDLCFSGFLLLESQSPTFSHFQHFAYFYMVKSQVSRNFTKLKVPFLLVNTQIFFAIFFAFFEALEIINLSTVLLLQVCCAMMQRMVGFMDPKIPSGKLT